MKLPILRKKAEPTKKMSVFDRDMMPLRDVMNRLFEESVWDPFRRSSWTFPTIAIEEWMPRADVSETDKEITIKVNAPGVDPAKIKVSVEDSTLIISGKTEEEREEKGKTFYRLEREQGEFSRSFTLPESADSNNISAESENGTVTLVIPKKPMNTESKKQEIEVKVK